MALPRYDKSKRRKSFELLPKGAYVVKIMSAKEDTWPSGGKCIKIAFDIAEGEHKDFYRQQFDASSNEDKQWSFDAIFNLDIPDDNSKEYVWNKYNTFFADLEDSNNGFVFSGDLKSLAGKVIGGKFALRQTEKNGNVYDHTKLMWTCVADDVRNGRAGKMPADKLVSAPTTPMSAIEAASGFMAVPETDDEIPF